LKDAPHAKQTNDMIDSQDVVEVTRVPEFLAKVTVSVLSDVLPVVGGHPPTLTFGAIHVRRCSGSQVEIEECLVSPDIRTIERDEDR